MSLPNNKSDDEPVINTPDKPVINTPDKPVINTPDKPLNAISFGFKKISQNKVDLSNIVKTDDKVYREKKTPSKSSSTRVIPLIEKNRWRNLDKLDDLDKQAVEELMKDSISSVTTSHQQVNEEKLDYSIPMLLRNRAPDGFDNADKLDVSIYPEESTLDDYEENPIEGFGIAMLRGMGWKKGSGVGKTFKRDVPLFETQLRPVGLGLGADIKAPPKEGLSMKKNAYVIIESGIHKNKCGVVTFVDSDLARCDVMLARDDDVTTNLPEASLRVVTKREYESRLDNTCDVIKKSVKKKKRKKSPSMRSPRRQRKKGATWLRANMKVRVVSNNYRRGKFYREKVVVEDVYNDAGDCLCRHTASGELLDDLNESILETVIPKSSKDAYVIITSRGKSKHDGKCAKILRRDTNSCRVYVQLIEDRHIVEKLYFDEVCEFVGDVEDDAMF